MKETLRKKLFHIIFLGLWAIITYLLFLFFGDEFILFSKMGFEWGVYVVLWISLPVLYLGKFIFRWRKLFYGIYLIAALLLIPLVLHARDSYLHNSEQKAITEFISTINEGKTIPDKFIVVDPEEVKCFSMYTTPTYDLSGSKFFGSVMWLIEFENGQFFAIYTTRQDLFHWEVEVQCTNYVDS